MTLRLMMRRDFVAAAVERISWQRGNVFYHLVSSALLALAGLWSFVISYWVHYLLWFFASNEGHSLWYAIHEMWCCADHRNRRSSKT